jgi:hypothetical protein
VKWRCRCWAITSSYRRRGGSGPAARRGDDATIGVGDDWQIRPNIELQVGARAEARRFGDARTQVLAPRVSLKYDFTQEGRSDVFIAYQRVPRLDDGLPGDWLVADARHHDELATGVSYLPTAGNSSVMFGVGGRARWTADTKAELGLETWVRTIAFATSFMRARRRSATSERSSVSAGSSIAAPTISCGRRAAHRARSSEGGGACGSTRALAALIARNARDLSFDLALEGYGGTEGPAGRMLLGASW